MRLDVEAAGWRRRTRGGTSESRLGFRDVDLDAVCPLCGRVLSERSGSFGCQEASAGFLPLAVLKVQRTLTQDAAAPPGRPLWRVRGPLSLLQDTEGHECCSRKMSVTERRCK